MFNCLGSHSGLNWMFCRDSGLIGSNEKNPCVECVSSSLGSSGDHYQVHISLIPIMSSPLISTRLCLHKRVYKMYSFASLSKLVFFEGFEPKFHLAINKIFSRLTRCKRNVGLLIRKFKDKTCLCKE